MKRTDNLRVSSLRPLIASGLLMHELPITEAISENILQTRESIHEILEGRDKRLVVVVGPCSIHDPEAAIEYASKLQQLSQQYRNELCIIMRVYFEKPRTTVGWKGLINDPHLDNSFNINEGLRTSRQLLLEINALGLATGSEFLDTIIPQYISDLTSWAAIGARTVESQIHRELASGLSMPVGFKNGTAGSIQIAVDAVYAAQRPHHFLGVTEENIAAIVETSGNPNCHIILRGSKSGPNYHKQQVEQAAKLLADKSLKPRIMIDCSHGNSGKDHTRQHLVVDEVIQQLRQENHHIFGLMLESNLIEGRQDKPEIYGKSITDACIGWDETQQLLDKLAGEI